MLLLVATIFTFVSCKKKKDDDADDFVWNPYPYENLGDFISLPDYKNFTISQAFIERQINMILASLFEEKNIYVDVTEDREVREWDFVKLEFISIVVGDTTVFPEPDNGEGNDEEEEEKSSVSFPVGTGVALSYLEEGVVGMKRGEEKEITFTYAADYTANPDFAGKNAVYKFKLAEHKEPPVLDDDLCYRYTNYVNPEIMHDMLEQEIIYSELWKFIFDGAVLKSRPEKEYNDYYNEFVGILKDYAKSNNKTLEEYVTTEGENFPSMGLYEGITMDEFYKLAESYADEHLKNDLILYYLVRLEDLKTSGPLYEAAQRELLLSYGIGYTIDSLIQQHGRTEIVTSIMDIQVRKQVLKYVTKTA